MAGGVENISGGLQVTDGELSVGVVVAVAGRRPKAGLVAVAASGARAAGWQFSQWCFS